MKTPFSIIKNVIVGKNRGIAIIYIALSLVALLAFVGLAIDIGYMYVGKTQLQNAADSASLAGAVKLKYIGSGTANPNDLVQTDARNEAISFALKNKAAKQDIVIENDDSNVLGNDNDITVGHWNGTSYVANSTPINAIEVRTRRTSDSPGGKIATFFGKVLGKGTMGASAVAVATLPLRGTALFAICLDSCSGVSSDPDNPTILSPPRILDRNPTIAGSLQFAWTSLLVQTSSTPEITNLVCTENPKEEVCNKTIWTSQGTSAASFKDLEAVFNDPNFDRDNKEYTGSQVSAWWVIIPVTSSCPVTKQGIGNGTEPKAVSHYALVRVISACDTGGGTACRPYSSSNCPHAYAKKIVIDRIACINCGNIDDSSGLKPSLVK